MHVIKQPHEMTQDEFRRHSFIVYKEGGWNFVAGAGFAIKTAPSTKGQEQKNSVHKMFVENAIELGKIVPAEVLDEYTDPDFQPRWW